MAFQREVEQLDSGANCVGFVQWPIVYTNAFAILMRAFYSTTVKTSVRKRSKRFILEMLENMNVGLSCFVKRSRLQRSENSRINGRRPSLELFYDFDVTRLKY